MVEIYKINLTCERCPYPEKCNKTAMLKSPHITKQMSLGRLFLGSFLVRKTAKILVRGSSSQSEWAKSPHVLVPGLPGAQIRKMPNSVSKHAKKCQIIFSKCQIKCQLFQRFFLTCTLFEHFIIFFHIFSPKISKLEKTIFKTFSAKFSQKCQKMCKI